MKNETNAGSIIEIALNRLTLIVALLLVLSGVVVIHWVLPRFTEEGVTDSHLIRDAAIAAIVAGTLGTLYDILMRKGFREVTQESLNNTLTHYGLSNALAEYAEELKELAELRKEGRLIKPGEALKSNLEELYKIREQGLKDIHNGLKSHTIKQKFGEAKETVQILESWTGLLESGIAPLACIRKAVERGCEVQVLLIDPYTEAAKYRAWALERFDPKSYNKDKVIQAIIDDLEALEGLREELEEEGEYKGTLEIKAYNAPAILEIYRFDQTWIFGMHLHGAESTGGPQFEVVGDERNGPPDTLLAEKVNDHFNKLWDKDEKRTRKAAEVIAEIRQRREAKEVRAEIRQRRDASDDLIETDIW